MLVKTEIRRTRKNKTGVKKIHRKTLYFFWLRFKLKPCKNDIIISRMQLKSNYLFCMKIESYIGLHKLN